MISLATNGIRSREKKVADVGEEYSWSKNRSLRNAGGNSVTI